MLFSADYAKRKVVNTSFETKPSAVRHRWVVTNNQMDTREAAQAPRSGLYRLIRGFRSLDCWQPGPDDPGKGDPGKGCDGPPGQSYSV